MLCSVDLQTGERSVTKSTNSWRKIREAKASLVLFHTDRSIETPLIRILAIRYQHFLQRWEMFFVERDERATGKTCAGRNQ